MLADELIRLRRLEEQDLELRTKWLNDPDVVEAILADYPISLSESRKWFNNTLLNRERWDFIVDEIGSERSFAMAGFINVDLRHRRAQLYITIGEPDFRGKGYASRILTILLGFGFGELGLQKIYLYTPEVNKHARSVYEHFGFKQEACMRRHVFVRGRHQDLYQHSMLREEFLER